MPHDLSNAPVPENKQNSKRTTEQPASVDGFNSASTSYGMELPYTNLTSRQKHILFMQRTQGNAAVQRMINRLRADATVVRREDIPPKRADVGTRGQLKSLSGWTYVVYAAEILLMNRTGSATIGTIPWITHNPGNITAQAMDSKLKGDLASGAVNKDNATLQQLPYLMPGATGKTFTNQIKIQEGPNAGKQTTYSYPIFENAEQGRAAIGPYVSHVRGQTVKDKIFNYVSTSEPQDKYIANMRNYWVNTLKHPQGDFDAFLAKPGADLTEDDQSTITSLISFAEGDKASPGMTFTCGGFVEAEPDTDFAKEKAGSKTNAALIDQLLQNDQARAELDGLLGCKTAAE